MSIYLCFVSVIFALPFVWSFTKVIVPSVYREWDHGKPFWTSVDLQHKFNYSVFVYQKLNASEPNYIDTNRGTEAGVYLRYIVDHYHNFPDVAVFVHAEPEKHAWNWFNETKCIRPNATYININFFGGERVCRSPLTW